MKTGKKPFVPDSRDIKFSMLKATTTLPPVPSRFGHGTMFKDWGMLGNDYYGDCVFAGAAHETMETNKIAGRTVTFNDTAVLSDYSAVTGFDPSDPSTDQGTEVRDALKYRRRTGIVDANGVRHKIGAYVLLDPKSWDDLMEAVYIFSAVGIGFEFPDSAMDQFNRAKPWTVVPGAQIEGGHYVPVMGRTAINNGGCITWARRQTITKDFYETYNDEAWAMIYPEELRNGKTERGMDLAALNAALLALS